MAIKLFSKSTEKALGMGCRGGEGCRGSARGRRVKRLYFPSFFWIASLLCNTLSLSRRLSVHIIGYTPFFVPFFWWRFLPWYFYIFVDQFFLLKAKWLLRKQNPCLVLFSPKCTLDQIIGWPHLWSLHSLIENRVKFSANVSEPSKE